MSCLVQVASKRDPDGLRRSLRSVWNCAEDLGPAASAGSADRRVARVHG